LLIALSLMPALVGFFMHIPRPVIGAALVFTACFVLINGLQIITSRLLDARRIFVIGLSLTLSLSRDIFPEYYGTLPAILHPFVASDLVVALLVAMILNALFRIGVKRRQSLSLTPGADGPEIVRAFFEQNGRVWGARRDVIDRAIYGCDQAIEVIADYCELQGPIEIEAAFDEYNFNVSLSYDGEMLEFPERRPTEEEILESPDGIRQLGGYLLHRNADRVRAARRGNLSVLEFHFSH
jgi:xanthine permease XanP